MSASAVALSDPSSPSQPAEQTASMRLRGIPVGQQVILYFRPTGSVPILKKTKKSFDSSLKFSFIMDWLRRILKFQASDSLYLFVNGNFVPSPDAILHDLFQCYQINNELVINYSIQYAWG
jgi:ubiquitin-like protein ATG12